MTTQVEDISGNRKQEICAAPDEIPADTLRKLARLRKFNIIAAVLHFVQFIFMIAAGSAVKNFADFKLPITKAFLVMSPQGFLMQKVEVLGFCPIAPLVAIFFLLSAVFQGATVIGCFNTVYNKDLLRGVNRYRWYEYALSSSLMIVIIAMFVGVSDVGEIILIFFINASMNLFGLLQETMNSGKQSVDWTPFVFGWVPAFPPWLVIFLHLGWSTQPPGFVYGIFASYLILFNTFPLNMLLQYMRVGKWADYMYGEFVYIILSLVAKTLLGWLVFGGLNQPNEFTKDR